MEDEKSLGLIRSQIAEVRAKTEILWDERDRINTKLEMLRRDYDTLLSNEIAALKKMVSQAPASRPTE
jgi:hypothetical protein